MSCDHISNASQMLKVVISDFQNKRLLKRATKNHADVLSFCPHESSDSLKGFSFWEMLSLLLVHLDSKLELRLLFYEFPLG